MMVPVLLPKYILTEQPEVCAGEQVSCASGRNGGWEMQRPIAKPSVIARLLRRKHRAVKHRVIV